MAKPNDHRAPHLYVVSEDDPPSASKQPTESAQPSIFDDLEAAAYKVRPEIEVAQLESDAAKPLPSGKPLYMQVPVGWLCDPVKNRHYSRAIRLYGYLQIKSRRGACRVVLTNAMARTAGLEDSGNRARALQELEAEGYIAVEHRSGRFPVITVRRFEPVDYKFPPDVDED